MHISVMHFTQRLYNLGRDRTGAWFLNVGRIGFWIERTPKPPQRHTSACRMGYGPCKCKEHIPPGSVPSPSTYDEWGYYNWFGGFHKNKDHQAYFGLLALILKKPWNKAHRVLGRRFIWRRWVHRRCDTTDFHHDIYCILDPWVQKREKEQEYVEVWAGHYPPLEEA